MKTVLDGNASITWTPEKLEEFRKARDVAASEQLEMFRYEGHLFLVRYANYLIQYLDTEFKRRVGN